MTNIHASCVALGKKGILLIGPSGAGKSDLALRLIEQTGAILVSDDRTDLSVKNNRIYASCPENIKGLLEVRGIGIIKQKIKKEISVNLVVDLVKSLKDIERLPSPDFWVFETKKIKKIKIYPFEPSAVYKIRLACDEK